MRFIFYDEFVHPLFILSTYSFNLSRIVLYSALLPNPLQVIISWPTMIGSNYFCNLMGDSLLMRYSAARMIDIETFQKNDQLALQSEHLVEQWLAPAGCRHRADQQAYYAIPSVFIEEQKFLLNANSNPSHNFVNRSYLERCNCYKNHRKLQNQIKFICYLNFYSYHSVMSNSSISSKGKSQVFITMDFPCSPALNAISLSSLNRLSTIPAMPKIFEKGGTAPGNTPNLITSYSLHIRLFFPISGTFRSLLQLIFRLALQSKRKIESFPVTSIVFEPHSKGVDLTFEDYSEVLVLACSRIQNLASLLWRQLVILMNVSSFYVGFSSIDYYFYIRIKIIIIFKIQKMSNYDFVYSADFQKGVYIWELKSQIIVLSIQKSSYHKIFIIFESREIIFLKLFSFPLSLCLYLDSLIYFIITFIYGPSSQLLAHQTLY